MLNLITENFNFLYHSCTKLLKPYNKTTNLQGVSKILQGCSFWINFNPFVLTSFCKILLLVLRFNGDFSSFFITMTTIATAISPLATEVNLGNFFSYRRNVGKRKEQENLNIALY